MNNNLRRKKGAMFLLAAGIIAFTGAGPTARAAFDETSVSARASAMGGMFVAMTDDVNSLYHNPAGLAGVERTEVSAQYSRLYMGMDDKSNLGYSFLGVVRPFKIKGVYDSLGAGWLRFALSGLYQENTFIFSYATRRLYPDLDAGISFKYLRIKYGQDEYTSNAVDNDGNSLGTEDSLFKDHGTSKGNIDFDLGAKYRLAENYVAGFMIENLLEPNMALDPSVSCTVPRTFKAGIAHTGKDYSLTVDGLYKKIPGDTDLAIACGGEKKFMPGIAARGGITVGSRELMNCSLGLGYRFNEIDVDYALIYPISGIKDTMGTHRFSLLFRFGPVIKPQEGNVDILKNEIEVEKKQRQAAESQLADARKEIENLRAELKSVLEKPASPASAVKGTVVQPADASQAKPAVTTPAAEYQKDLNRYQRISENLSLQQRINHLKTVIERYKDKTAVTEAEKELGGLQTEYASSMKDFNDSMTYYRKMAERGISIEERIDILKRVIKKFDNTGVDLSTARRELDSLIKQAR